MKTPADLSHGHSDQGGTTQNKYRGHLHTKSYDIRLVTSDARILLFATAVETDEAAADYAERKMLRYGCDRGEVWCSMRLVWQLSQN